MEGVCVTEVEAGGGFTRKFQPGMVISEANGETMGSPEDLKEAMGEGLNNLYVWYEGVYDYLTLRMD